MFFKKFYLLFMYMKRVYCWLLAVMMIMCPFFSLVSAVDSDPFVLIPEAKDPNYWTEKVDKLTNPNTDAGKKFWNAYNVFAGQYTGKKNSEVQCDIGSMLSSGIVTRDTILCLLIRIVKFVANMALIVWSAMIIYAGYLYTISALSGTSVDETSQANEAIKNAAIGIVIVTFSYAIQRIVTQAFLS